jgi:hypothetical protein
MATCRLCRRSGLFLLTDRDDVCHVCGEIAAAGDPAEVVDDMANPEIVREKAALGKRYVVLQRRMQSFVSHPVEIHAWENALWVYPRSDTTRVHHIPVYTSWRARVHFTDGVVDIPARGEQDAADLVAHVARKAPFALTGYSRELEETSQLRPAELREAVARRRAALADSRDDEYSARTDGGP